MTEDTTGTNAGTNTGPTGDTAGDPNSATNGDTNGAVRLLREPDRPHVATLLLDRPAKLNAMTVAMDRQMNDLVYEINNDDQIRTIVLRGAGERAFCVGSDINDLDAYGSMWQYRNRFDARLDYARAVWQIRKPVIAAIRGYCIGGGLEMASASDIRIATPDSSYAAGEIRWGWHGGSGQTQLLTHLVGPGHASLFLLTGDRVDAETAARMGLLQRVVEADALSTEAYDLATRIARHSPVAVQRTKHMVRMAQNLPLDAALLVENDSFAACMSSEDAAEGRRAFAEKREPNFPGR